MKVGYDFRIHHLETTLESVESELRVLMNYPDQDHLISDVIFRLQDAKEAIETALADVSNARV